MNSDGTVAWSVSHGSPQLKTQSAAITSDESFIFVNTGSGTHVDIHKFSTVNGHLDVKYLR